MKIECDHNPDNLIDAIGDRFFHIDPERQFKDHIFIRDCEDGVLIQISSDHGKAANLESAIALCALLNQKYDPCDP